MASAPPSLSWSNWVMTGTFLCTLVIIEEDCWLGGNVALLSGVTIKRGTTVANGAVVAKDTVPYSVWGGVPARFIKFYWTIDQIMEHEAQLYSPEERYSKTELEEIFAKYQ